MKTAFLFPGQGSQYPGMLDGFDRPEEKRRIAEAGEILGADILAISRNEPAGSLDLTFWTQPAILLASVLALGRIRETLVPDVVLGHSLGEYSALVSAGALSFGDAIRLVYKRGRFMQEAVPEGEGLMAAVLGPERDRVEKILGEARTGEAGVVSVANDNCPGQCVIAGSRQAVLRAIEFLKEAGVRKVVPLSVSVPSHTALMHSAALAMQDLLAGVAIGPLSVKIVPNVTARPIGPGEAAREIRELLVRQMESPVEWRCSVAGILGTGVTRCVEVGPGSVLTGLGKRIERGMESMPEKVLWETTDRKEEEA